MTTMHSAGWTVASLGVTAATMPAAGMVAGHVGAIRPTTLGSS